MDAVTLANLLDGIFKISLVFIISSAPVTLLLYGFETRISKALYILWVSLICVAFVSFVTSMATLKRDFIDVGSSSKKYLYSQISDTVPKEFSIPYSDFNFKDWCYVDFKESLNPGDVVLLQTKGTKVWTKLQSDEQTLQEVEYIVHNRYIANPFVERMVNLLQFNLSDFEKCAPLPSQKEEQRLKQQQEFDRLSDPEQSSSN